MTSLRAFAATVLVAGGTVLVAPATAGAATCADGNGVSVVVDYRELGGSTVTACAANGAGKSAAAIFAEVSVKLSYAARQPGFVCRVNDVPAADPCVNTSPADAFWGLWWSDGTRPWTYSSSGVGSLTVPAGGSVGWAWQQDRAAGQTVPPAVAAPKAPEPSPTATSSPTATATPTASPTSSPTSSPSSSPSPTRSPGATASPTRKDDDTGAKQGSRPGRATGSDTGDTSADDDPDQPSATAEPSKGAESLSPDPKKRKQEKAEKTADPTPGTATGTPTEEATDGSGSTTEPPGAAEAEAADEPARVPAAVTWGVVALLGGAVLVSVVVSRRRRGA